MKGDIIPDSDHIARYCKKTSTAPDGEIQATAFLLRQGEESLSVNWLEELSCPDRSSEVRALQNLYRKKMTRVGAGARIAILSVGIVRTKVQRESPDGRLLRVLHEPEPDDPSHSGIYELRQDSELVAELIAQVVLENPLARA